ncbi:MAG: hypothetical protein XE10_0109 [Methanoculleus marisnigri]|jgi:hypothetical protein|uniref:Uncharacterized protein n=1 Tax=Methanoculleus marisnigri TaxID=2198 RepID=A0A101J241_9EURY|nr:MAG: hypothetical protein XD82_0129 [Methanoculleus marisnigri]KUL05591.1 MAG: hypothetical protein XE10_0109 [Methanoculleus marisnigri]
MANFEREITCCINRFFAHRQAHGFAYRLKQSKCNTQYSLDPRYYPAIECKSSSGSVQGGRRRHTSCPGAGCSGITGTCPASLSTISGSAVRSTAPVRSTIFPGWIQINILSHYQRMEKHDGSI